jgi:arylsulfatase A-like enzyme
MNRRTFTQTIGKSIAGLAASSILSHLSCSIWSKPPNIILLLTDDQRWDALRCAGNTIIQTPNMDFLSENGIRFANSYVTTPICAASRASIFTGLYERIHGYTFTKPPIAIEYIQKSYPYLLRQAKYRTGFIGKFGVKVPEGAIEEMFDEFHPDHYPYFKMVEGKQRHLTDVNFDRAISFIQSCNPEQPFCLSLSTDAPHADDGAEEQYFWPEICNDLYQDIEIPRPHLSDPAFFKTLPGFIQESLNRKRWYWRFDTTEKYQKMVKGYYRMISGVDMALGRLMAALKKLNMDQNTVVILTSDNGYFLGERGFAGKWTMHDVSIRVPLIIFDPRIPDKNRNQVIDKIVLNIDLTPTILELAGVAIPSGYQGESLMPLTNAKGSGWRTEILTEHLWDRADIPQTEGLRTENWKYIRYPQHPEYEELYNLDGDPWEGENLVNNPVYRDHLNQLREKCDKLVEHVKA